eukprot:3570851-Amphidinium_carterae.1
MSQLVKLPPCGRHVSLTTGDLSNSFPHKVVAFFLKHAMSSGTQRGKLTHFLADTAVEHAQANDLCEQGIVPQ